MIPDASWLSCWRFSFYGYVCPIGFEHTDLNGQRAGIVDTRMWALLAVGILACTGEHADRIVSTMVAPGFNDEKGLLEAWAAAGRSLQIEDLLELQAKTTRARCRQCDRIVPPHRFGAMPLNDEAAQIKACNSFDSRTCVAGSRHGS